jgi:hypothetical protein
MLPLFSPNALPLQPDKIAIAEVVYDLTPASNNISNFVL